MDDRSPQTASQPDDLSEKTQWLTTQSDSPSEKTQLGASRACPVCETDNAPSEIFCAECGFQLDVQPGKSLEEIKEEAPALLADTNGNLYPLHEGENMIGRTQADVLLPNPAVSRKHARIVVKPEKITLEDLGSSNGTSVDGEPLLPGEQRTLSQNSEVSIAGITLTLRSPQESSQESEHKLESKASGIQEEPFQLPSDEPDEALIDPSETVDTETRHDRQQPRLVLPGGQVFTLSPGTNTVGRRAGNDVILPDAYTSGLHAEIIIDGDAAFLVDRGSTNGTLLNNQRLSASVQTTLASGDELTFGRTHARFIWYAQVLSPTGSPEDESLMIADS